MKIGELFSADALQHALTERLVVRRLHPAYPLAILNYTERCQYERGLWSPVTMACRGIIYDVDSGDVLARPFRKFFNYGQEGAPTLDLAAPVAVTDKLDGSLGVLYPTPEGWMVATRGSFESDQALHATRLYRSRYEVVAPPPGWTVLYEIVYPENRIVLDYAGLDDLILLGAVEIETGRSIGPHDPLLDYWPGPRADPMECPTLADALALPPRPNAEGVVIHCLTTDERVKLKQEDYVALHRIVTGLNERTVWEHLAAGKDVTDLIAPLPDEFHEWVREVAAGLVAKVEADAAEVERAYSTILATLPAEYTRKEFAASAITHPLNWALFSRHDGKEYQSRLWKAHYPAGLLGPKQFSEDTA